MKLIEKQFQTNILVFEETWLDAATKLSYECWHEMYDSLLPQIIIEEKSYEYFKQSLKKRSNMCFIALINNKLVGLVITSSNCIDELWVSSQYRGKSIGSQLIKTIENQFIQRGFDSMQVGCESFNKDAINFFETLKWKHVGSEPLTIDSNNTIDVIVLCKSLQ